MASWLEADATRRLKDAIDWHLANVQDDRNLRDRLEGMAAEQRFQALAWYWAPLLYRRNRALFRPFIHQHFTDYWLDGKDRIHLIDWDKPVATSLDPWLTELERGGEVRLFQRVYGWKYRHHFGLEVARWRADLGKAFGAASPAERRKVLQLYDMDEALDESTALQLYRIDPAAAGGFILRHLPTHWFHGETKRVRFDELAAAARAGGDETFYFQLYRAQVPIEAWQRDALELCQQIHDPAALNIELERRHPDRSRGSLGKGFQALLEARGLDVEPYVRKHLRQVLGFSLRSAFKPLFELAEQRGWIDFSLSLVVTCGNPEQYNRQLQRLLEANLDEPERLRRLRLLSGVSHEWNGMGWGFAQVQPLSSANAATLYRRYPALTRQMFKANITPGWSESYLELFELAWERGDEELADFLASRYATREYASKRVKTSISENVASKYADLKLDATAFARRAASVLTLIPAYSIYNFNHLVRENRLARLLFERSLPHFLSVPAAVRDLVEGSEIHVQQLAYRVLGLHDPRAETQARDNLDILIGTLLRPLHRQTRLAAFGALRNAASTPATAALILTRARDAFSLPNRRYPKEQLLGLVGQILARYPELASPAEQPVIYRRASA